MLLLFLFLVLVLRVGLDEVPSVGLGVDVRVGVVVEERSSVE